MPHPRLGLTVDTGHLKVSAQTLKFDREQFIRTLRSKIRAFQHSDNLGTSDTNLPLARSYWFLKFMPQFKAAEHVLEVDGLTVAQAKQQIALLRQAMEAA